MNTHVTFETAKLLKEKGFDGSTNSFFFDDTPNSPITKKERIQHNKIYKAIAAPTIAEVVMWLYEKHGIWIVILPELLNGTEIRYYPSVFEQGVGEDLELYFNSLTEAYQEAITHTLKNLI